MLPESELKRCVNMRLPKLTEINLSRLARTQGLRTGPFAVHVMQTIAECPPEKFHAAMSEFLREAGKR
jgi:hypothetical protein